MKLTDNLDFQNFMDLKQIENSKKKVGKLRNHFLTVLLIIFLTKK